MRYIALAAVAVTADLLRATADLLSTVVRRYA